MIKLLILADDFTGGLDTGVQFASRGISTCVITNPAADFVSEVLTARYSMSYGKAWRQGFPISIRKRTPPCAAISARS